MTVINPPAWLQTGSYPARTDRLVMASIVASSGRVSSSDLVVTQSATPGMRVTVSAGRAWILGTTTVYQGAYNLVNDSAIEVVITASSAINPRRDLIIARIQDATISGSVDSATIEVVTGTPAASPVTPAAPANSIVLAVIAVAANASSIVTANINTSMVLTATLFSQMKNDIVVCTSTTRPVGIDRYVGVRILETDTLREWTWNGSAWSYRGGGPAPRSRIATSGTSTWGNNNGEVFTMGPLPNELDSGYFSYVNGTSRTSGDRLKVKQSGNYLVEASVYIDGGTSSFYSQVVATYGPALVNFGSGEVGAASISGSSKLFVTRPQYLVAGHEVGLQVWANNSGASLVSAWLQLTMIP